MLISLYRLRTLSVNGNEMLLSGCFIIMTGAIFLIPLVFNPVVQSLELDMDEVSDLIIGVTR